jgi:tetratricopeptide (TPR) repeat protein
MQKELVQEQLERILASGSLGHAEALVRLLRFVVQETLEGRASQLKEYTLGVEVFQRGPEFDPRIDTIVRTQARRLRAKLHEYYSVQRDEDRVVIGLPKGTYVPVFRPRDAASPAVPARVWTVAAAAAAVLLMMTGLASYRNSDGPRVPATSDSEAYRLYLKGRFEPDPYQALLYLNRSLLADQRMAPAWLAQAEAYLGASRSGGQAPVRLLPNAREAALRAIALGQDTAAAHRILAYVAAVLDWDFPVAEREYRQAIERDPFDGWTRLHYAHLLAMRGRQSEAFEQLQRIGPIDPTSTFLAANQAGVYYQLRAYDKVIAHCKAVLEAAPEAADCHYWTGRAHFSMGNKAEAVAALERRGDKPWVGFGWPITSALAMGRREEAQRMRTQAERRASRGYVSPVSLAQMHFAFGEMDAGFGELERALSLRDPSVLTLKAEPGYDGVRKDHRFQKMLSRLRL